MRLIYSILLLLLTTTGRTQVATDTLAPHGIYHHSSLRFYLTEQTHTKRTLTSAGLHQVLGFQHNYWLGTGIGAGVDVHYNRTFIPVYGEFRGTFWPASSALFYTVQLGYSFFIPSHTQQNYLQAQGGFYLAPHLGWRFSTERRTHFTLSLGYVAHPSTLTEQIQNSIYNESRYYQRLSFRVGVLLY